MIFILFRLITKKVAYTRKGLLSEKEGEIYMKTDFSSLKTGFTSMRTDLSSNKIEWKMAFAHEADACKFNEFKCINDVAASGLDVLEATVPGNFELDLFKNGIVDDPFFGTNVLQLHNYEDCHVWYFTKFSADTTSQQYTGNDAWLVFEGLDTYADIYLNGSLLASKDNMLVPHKIPVNGLLKQENELLIHIRPAVLEARKYEYSVYERAAMYNYEAIYVRKAPHMYGWDIMPRIVSAGIWRPVYIEYRQKERIEEIYIQTISITGDGGDATLLCNFNVKTDNCLFNGYEMLIEGKYEDPEASTTKDVSRKTCEFSIRKKLQYCAGSISFRVRNAKLWWPEGRGKPNLYKVTVSLIKNGEVLDVYNTNVGIRTVKLVRTSTTDENGNGEFCFIINREKVFAKGTNWVPADAFHSRDRERIPRILEMAKDLKCNIIRCWGGNVYEDDIFYDICDRYGIMVWQDFTMACAIYPQSVEFAKRLEHEAIVIVKKMRQHPCIILWAGDNECDSAHGWGISGRDPNTNILTRKVLPEVIRRHDPTRQFIPSSPYIDEEAFIKGQKYLPENHLWGPRNYFKSDFYKNALCHFASEIGYHGCPSVESIKKFISPESLWPYKDNREWLMHATSYKLEPDDPHHYRIELMARQVRVFFGFVPDNLDEYVKASQITQAEAFKFFIEFFRGRKWRTTGIIWWNLMDGWPQFSDAIVDYYFDKKLAYEYIKLSQQHICVMIKEAESYPGGSGKMYNEVVVCNDTREGAAIEYEIVNIEDGSILLKGRGYAAADSTVSLGRVSFEGNTRPEFYVIRWTIESGKDIKHESGEVIKHKSGKGINHYTTGLPVPLDTEQKVLESNFKRYLNWLDKYMDEVRQCLSTSECKQEV